MTEPSDFERDEAPLPGLEPAKPGESALVRATRRTIAALRRDGLLLERHAMLCQLMLDLSEVVDAGRANRKAAAAAMAAAQLREAYVLLLPDSTEGGLEDDAWGELVADLRRGATAARDAARPGPGD